MECARALSYAQSKPSLRLLPSHSPLLRPTPLAAFKLRTPLFLLPPPPGVKCEFGGSCAPLEPSSPEGRYLTGVLLDDRHAFPDVARKELERLALQRDQAVARLHLSRGSDEASLHRRIAELKRSECNVAVEDIVYALVLHKFYEINVHLVPKLSKCICNCRLEIGPSMDWQLESIYSVDVLEMVREHISSVIGCRANSSVKENWTTTKIQQSSLCTFYRASILFGYFLKTASLRRHLEWGLDHGNNDLHAGTFAQLPVMLGSEYIAFGRVNAQRSLPEGRGSFKLERKHENLRCYVMGFDQETIQMCAKPKSMEAVNLIERHISALFGDENLASPETGEVITTSYASLKRLLLEAVAFGWFLWGAEKWAHGVVMLEENQV